MKLIKDKYLKKVEQMLEEYTDIKQELANTTEISAISYKEGTRGRYGKGSITEKIALEEVKKENLLNKLDTAIATLDHMEQKIIKYYYINNIASQTTLRQISILTGYDERHVKRIKSNAIQKIAYRIYGDNVIDIAGIGKRLRGE